MFLNFCSSCFFFGLVVSLSKGTSWANKPDVQSRTLEDDELDGLITLHLYHSVEPSDSPPIYTKRGIITISSIRNEATYIEENPLSTADVEMLKKLASSDDIYRVKLTSKPDETDNTFVLSFTKACGIYESGLNDVITIALDQSNVPVSVAISAAPLSYLENPPSFSKPSSFNTTVNLVSLINGPSPDTLTYIQRLEQEKAEKARGEQGDNRSFLAKYWMYIVPVVIFLFISGASGPEGQAGGR